MSWEYGISDVGMSISWYVYGTRNTWIAQCHRNMTHSASQWQYHGTCTAFKPREMQYYRGSPRSIRERRRHGHPQSHCMHVPGMGQPDRTVTACAWQRRRQRASSYHNKRLFTALFKLRENPNVARLRPSWLEVVPHLGFTTNHICTHAFSLSRGIATATRPLRQVLPVFV